MSYSFTNFSICGRIGRRRIARHNHANPGTLSHIQTSPEYPHPRLWENKIVPRPHSNLMPAGNIISQRLNLLHRVHRQMVLRVLQIHIGHMRLLQKSNHLRPARNSETYNSQSPSRIASPRIRRRAILHVVANLRSGAFLLRSQQCPRRAAAPAFKNSRRFTPFSLNMRLPSLLILAFPHLHRFPIVQNLPSFAFQGATPAA